MRLGSPTARQLAWALVPGTASVDGALERTRAFLADGTVNAGGVPWSVPYDGGEMWTSTSDRSRLRRLHALLFVADWRTAYVVMAADERAALAARAVDVVAEWVRRFGDRSTAPDMAYHDETTAQRLLMLTALGEEVLVGSTGRDAVRSLARDTAEHVADPRFHAGNNNHGMFQDTALLAYALLSDASSGDRRSELVDLALDRLGRYIEMCFTSEGVHIEHSPTYHLMVARTIASVADVAGEIGASEFAGRVRGVIEKAEKYATHATTPRGVFPPVSDSQQIGLRSAGNLAVFRSDAFRYAATRGAEGRAPDQRAAVFPVSGYAAFRSSWTDPDAVFCFFAAAYNGGYHKHSDELSLHVEVAGTEVLREAGPFGYNYQDPYTVYGFSSFAHNTLVVDDRSLPRHDGRMAETWLEDRGSGDAHLDVTGVTTRFAGVRFERHVAARGASRKDTVIEVEDTITSVDEHKYTVLWHLGPHVEPLVQGDHVELFVRGEKVLELAFETSVPFDLEVQRGREEPHVSGWTFPAMGRKRPTTTLALTAFAADWSLHTRIRSGGFTIRDRGVRPSGTPWQQRHGSVPLTYLLDLPEGEVRGLVVAFSAIHQPHDFTYNYRSTLDGLPAARLFVLDSFGDQGAYYHSRARHPGPFIAVQALIRDVLGSLGLTSTDLYTVGSSKGGTAAIVHGLAARAGRIVVGAPQTRIGTFLESAHPEVLAYMAGGTGRADVLWADRIVDRAVADASPSTAVSVLVGEADHHLGTHVAPFVRLARERGLDVDALVIPDAPHSRIGASFRQYLRSHMGWSLGDDVLPHCLAVSRNGDVSLSIARRDGARTAAKLFRDNELIDFARYGERDSYRWADLPSGAYRARVYMRPGRASDQGAFTTARVVVER